MSEDAPTYQGESPYLQEALQLVSRNNVRRVAELLEKNAKLRSGLLAVDSLIGESHGVYGLHRNGDTETWENLRRGGRFEDWLLEFDNALEIAATIRAKAES